MPAIIGTAGHIDHGKTALIKALTGQDTDRLKEEKERGISIDLGFAYLERPDGSRAGIVDVPGHERFIRNMLAGAHGMDVVLLVVAADDGVMPQTEEHLEILHLLGVERGIAVVTKADLVAADRLAVVREEVEILLAGTSLEGSPIVEVSAVTGEGLERLKAEIEGALARPSERMSSGYFRLPIDRAFVIKGHGTVVTGTAVSGALRAGEVARILPGGHECRVRALQVHSEAVSEAAAGQRVAVNLGGVEREQIRRGQVLVHPLLTRSTDRFDAVVELRPAARRPLKNLAPVRVHAGTAEVLGKLVWLDGRGSLAPGDTCFCQVVLRREIVASWGDRFVLRDQAAQRTLGGGHVLQPFALPHRRGDAATGVLDELLRAGDLDGRLRALVRSSSEMAAPISWLYQAAGVVEADVMRALAACPDLTSLPDADAPEVVIAADEVGRIEIAVVETLAALHRESPLVPGEEMELLRARVAPTLPARYFRTLLDRLQARGTVRREDSVVCLPGHTVTLAEKDLHLATRAEALLEQGGFKPPDLKELEAALGVSRKRLVEILSPLEREGRVSRVAQDLYYAREPLERARALLVDHARRHGEITAAAFRDLIDASRKFSIGLLDYFDRTGFTMRVGDVRKLRRE